MDGDGVQKRLPHIRFENLHSLAPHMSACGVKHGAGALIAVGAEDAIG